MTADVTSSPHTEAISLTNTKSNVIYERFYSKFSDWERAGIREAFAQASDGLQLGVAEEAEQCSRYRGGVVAVRAESDLVLYGLGTGEYDELSLAEALRAVTAALRALFKRAPTETLLLDNYGQLCLALDEMIQEGILESVEAEDVRRHIA
ncbi:hypothetical protein WJX73_000481 [Symbiochloris irregularis]|uniref:Coatomer subunit zeta n=1 Tax=Symbiochloris irregularis TaxID=706552 RepID=A0AAW1P922_9CHLO